jgi:hypothetical protein
MSFKKKFLNDIEEGLGDRIKSQGARPGVEVWPEEDEFVRWVSAHRDPVRSVVCNSPEFRDAPFCGRGYH